MTLTRGDVEEILRLRYEFTKERWGDGTVDAWWDLLGDLDPAGVKRRLRELIRGGATHVPPGLLAQGLTATVERAERRAAGDCDHGDSPVGQRCQHCRAELIGWNDPRAQAAFVNGYWESTGREWAGDNPTGEHPR
jgi:hypothetical protein